MTKGSKHVNTASAVESYVIGERVDRALKLIRNALAETELEIAAEFDHNGSRTLLVDCPLLNFEALALDRAAAVFFPLHLVVTPSGEQTRVSILDLPRAVGGRMPIGAEEPIKRLAARIRVALEAACQKRTPSR